MRDRDWGKRKPVYSRQDGGDFEHGDAETEWWRRLGNHAGPHSVGVDPY